MSEGMQGGLPRRPRLKQSIDVFTTSDGRLHLFRGGGDDFAIEDADDQARALLAALDGSRTVTGVRAALARQGHHPPAAELAGAIADLTAAGLVEDAAADALLAPRERERYDRQLRYFGDCAPAGATRAEYQSRLGAATVVVLGLGGLGSWAALALASAGVGRMVGVDGDRVEPSNLNRQVLYAEADVGRPKVHAASERLTALNGALAFEPVHAWLESAEQILGLVRGADFVVDAVDTPVHEIERWVNSACFGAGVPYIAMSQFPPLVRIGPTYVPGRTGCYACQEARWRREHPLYDEVAEHRRRSPCPAASFGPASALIGGAVALEVAHCVSGLAPPATLGSACTIDIQTLATSWEPVPRTAACRTCL